MLYVRYFLAVSVRRLGRQNPGYIVAIHCLDCTWPLGLAEWVIPNEAMSASSSLGTNYAPWMGRLGGRVGGGAWCAKSNDNTQYLQVDLGYLAKIQGLAIQGKEGVSRHPTLEAAWVKSFTLSHSVDGFSWTSHNGTEGPKVCSRIMNTYTSKHELE